MMDVGRSSYEVEMLASTDMSVPGIETESETGILKRVEQPNVNNTTAADDKNAGIIHPHPPRAPKPTKRRGHARNITGKVTSQQNLTALQNDAITEKQSSQEIHKSDLEQLMKATEGWCQFDELPSQSKKVVRIFVSSTFSDTKEERNAFMERVYPKLAEMCRQKYGLEFQVVDMRWGVPEQASDQHSTTELCLQEILKCQEISAGPNFVAILGNKYGYRPIPSKVVVEEFQILETIASQCNDERWKNVVEWYRLDENCSPPVFLLQPISDLIADYNNNESPELRKNARNKWNNTEDILAKCLRDNALSAFSKQMFSEEQKHKYFMSVTENEVTHGVFGEKTNPKESCICIIREIPDIKDHLHETKAPKFIDIGSEANSVDPEAEGYIKILRDYKVTSKLPEFNVAKVDIEWGYSGAVVSSEQLFSSDPASRASSVLLKKQGNVLRHEEYIDKLCSTYLEKLTKLISSAGEKQEKLYDDLNTEVLQHWHFAKERCQVFEGREPIMKQVKNYISRKTSYPLIVYGNSGCGKTSVIANMVQEISSAIAMKIQQGKKPLRLFFRFLGTTPETSNIQQVLVSICQQISSTCHIKWSDPGKYPKLVKSFHDIIKKVGKTHRVILVLDSVDQLLSAYNAYNMDWMPELLPKNVKFIISVLDEGYTIMDTLKTKHAIGPAEFIEVKPLPKEIGLLIVQKWLAKIQRRLSNKQEEVAKEALGVCGLPLYARILFDQVLKWKSYEMYSLDQLETTVKGAINKLYDQMEAKFGFLLVKHCLSYLTASRFGLSEMELEHIMSLDDELLNTVFTFWKPPIRRIPPLLWTRVRNEINSYIVERSADGILVLYWYHRQFISATREKYLSNPEFTAYIHGIMAEYFEGTWGGGIAKPFQYSPAQMTRFGLKAPDSKEDRMVPKQPYITEHHVDGHTHKRCNQRKVSEFPFHLLKVNNMDPLFKHVFFNLEWLYAKVKSSSVQALIQEMDIFMQSSRYIQASTPMKILFSTFQLTKAYVAKYPESLPYELSGRLAKYIESQPLIRLLLIQCDTVGLKLCPVVPIVTCFEYAQQGIKQNLTFAKSEHWHEGGTICCTDDFSKLYAILYNQTGQPFLSIWDTDNGHELKRIPIKRNIENPNAVHSYFQMLLHTSGRYLVALYRHKFHVTVHQDRKYTTAGYIDIIDVQTATVTRTMQQELYGREFYNCVYYMKGDWIGVRFGAKFPILHLFDPVKHRHSRPHMITNDCTKIINCSNRRIPTKYYAGNDKITGLTSTRSKFVHIKTLFREDACGKNSLADFKDSEFVRGITVTHDDRWAVLGNLMGGLQVYDLHKISFQFFKIETLKIKKRIPFSPAERIKIRDTLAESDSDGSDSDDEATVHGKAHKLNSETRNKISYRLALTVSPDDNFVLAVHQGPQFWEAFMYSLIKRGHFIGRVAENQDLKTKYPSFSSDGQYLVAVEGHTVSIVRCEDTKIVRKYNLNSDIRDFYVSKVSNQVAVMLGREIVFLDIADDGSNEIDKRKIKNDMDIGQEAIELLSRESLVNIQVLPVITAEKTHDCVKICEMKDPAEFGTKMLFTNAHINNETGTVIDAHISPNGKKALLLSNRIQVVDINAGLIQYTPSRGDILFEMPLKEQSSSVGRNIFGDDSFQLAVSLCPGDKVVGANGRVRWRVPDEQQSELKLSNFPSYISLTSFQENKTGSLVFGMNVYQETIAVVSDNYFATIKRHCGDFIKVYDLIKCAHLATHLMTEPITKVVMLPDESRLVILTKLLTVHTFSGPNFTLEQGKCSLTKDTTSTNYNVKETMIFTKNPDVLLVRYQTDNVTGTSEHSYVHLHTGNKAISPPLVTKLPLEDISFDGSTGVDAQLNLYDLPTGQLKTTIPYNNRSNYMQIQVRIGDNMKFIASVDKHDDTIHVVKLEGDEMQTIVSCHAHVPRLPPYGGFTLRSNGQIISLKGGERPVLLAIRESSLKLQRRLIYQDELERAVALIQQSNDHPEPNNTSFSTVIDTSNTLQTTGPMSEVDPQGTHVIVQDFLEVLGISN